MSSLIANDAKQGCRPCRGIDVKLQDVHRLPDDATPGAIRIRPAAQNGARDAGRSQDGDTAAAPVLLQRVPRCGDCGLVYMDERAACKT